MTNSILLHMPEHSRDISIHSKPFETVHDIEARLNPINKIQSDCPYIVLLIIFKYIYMGKSICKTSIRMIFFIKSIYFYEYYITKKVSSILYEC